MLFLTIVSFAVGTAGGGKGSNTPWAFVAVGIALLLGILAYVLSNRRSER